MRRDERAFGQLPLPVFALMLVAVCLVGALHFYSRDRISEEFAQLPTPLSADIYRAISPGSHRLLSYLLILNLQLHDNQGGRHADYDWLDYAVLAQWLETLYELNPRSDYPAFLASRIYSNVSERDKLRRMIDVIERLFHQDPERHWRRMTEACLLAKHRLGDLPRALDLAKQVAGLPQTVSMPYWARDMEIILLDELGELESARLLISSILQSGSVKDADEIRFLQDRLLKIQQSLSRNKHIPG